MLRIAPETPQVISCRQPLKRRSISEQMNAANYEVL